jgi:tetratricopeptide (TPR) repeat protein
MASAKFCVECGRALSGAASGAGDMPAGRGAAFGRNIPISTAFVFVFIAITIAGLGAAAWIMMRTPEAVRQQAAGIPAPPPPVSSAPPRAPAAPASSAEANVAAGGQNAGDLPPGHPRIELPTEARTFIDKIEKEAQSKPNDTAAWNKLGAVTMRAAMFDQSYYAKAEDAYGHVLKLEPDDLDALRGIGDIDYDKQHYDEAIAAYEHFLKKKPDDPEVRTDLGTMYLYTGNADQAVVQYKKALASKPDFFQAYYNMGIAYAKEDKIPEAKAAFDKSLKLAPDDTARAQVKDLIAKLSGKPGAASTQVASAETSAVPAPAPSPAAVASASGASPSPSAASPAATPSGASTPLAKPSTENFQRAIEKMVHDLPIAGPKVSSVQWPDKLKAKVMMDKFPMDQMPPFAKNKFITDLKLGIDSAKKDNQISANVELDIVDSASGRVMETVKQ